MAKEIFLIRHAQADPPDFLKKDIDRNLTSQGEIDASKMGNLLHTRGFHPDLFLCSVAHRTRQTAEFMCEQLAHDIQRIQYLEELFEASTRIMLQIVNDIDDQHNTVFLLAHNPAINYLSEYITGEVIGNVAPCGVVHMELTSDSWAEVSQNNVTFKEYFDPLAL